MNTNGILTSISNDLDKNVEEISFYIVVKNGEIEASFDDFELADGLVGRIEQENTDFVMEESGRDPEELTDDEYAEMEFWGGFEGDSAYVESIYIDEDKDLDENYETDEGDTFSYREIKEAFLSRKFDNDLFDELDDIDVDDMEDDDDFELLTE